MESLPFEPAFPYAVAPVVWVSPPLPPPPTCMVIVPETEKLD